MKLPIQNAVVPFPVMRLAVVGSCVIVMFQLDIFVLHGHTFEIVKHHRVASSIVTCSLHMRVGAVHFKLASGCDVTLNPETNNIAQRRPKQQKRITNYKVAQVANKVRLVL